MRSLEDVLKDLNDAEKEFKNKCEMYGIEEKSKRKPKVVEDNLTQENPQDNENPTEEAKEENKTA